MQLKLDDNFLQQLTDNINALYKQTVEQARRDVGMSKEYLTIPQALKYIDVSRGTLNNNFINKGLPTYVIEGKTYLKRSEINDFIASHKV